MKPETKRRLAIEWLTAYTSRQQLPVPNLLNAFNSPVTLRFTSALRGLIAKNGNEVEGAKICTLLESALEPLHTRSRKPTKDAL